MSNQSLPQMQGVQVLPSLNMRGGGAVNAAPGTGGATAQQQQQQQQQQHQHQQQLQAAVQPPQPQLQTGLVPHGALSAQGQHPGGLALPHPGQPLSMPYIPQVGPHLGLSLGALGGVSGVSGAVNGVRVTSSSATPQPPGAGAGPAAGAAGGAAADARASEGEHLDNSTGQLIGKSGKPLRNTKRAAQNRNAQKAFRQRRERYIKDLEVKAKEYDRMDAQTAALVQENESLKRYVLELEQRLGVRRAASTVGLPHEAHPAIKPPE
ncbi:bZIP transcription factor [Lachancea thermotolerans CBS 6340]|uniref:Putative transcription factor kapC n=1 Tax=Lachancea thermotolerans (strain ATCC 56472 / CBS 6340 / NRRL Y-8284) TaxID=559295 RepID=C5DH88_LACTC|nr:KLTH0E02222p [Lachancea thermotolerans CBS 6340]CAR23149.1 KLTH0E02222p [Lachancea thermotolerans CBS 6340]